MIQRTGTSFSNAWSTTRGLHQILDGSDPAQAGSLAVRFLVDGEEQEDLLSRGEMIRRSRSLAAILARHKVFAEPVVIALPPSCDFIIALLACWHAEAIAVPAYPPTSRRQAERLEAVIRDSGARLMLVAQGGRGHAGVETIEVGHDDPSDQGFIPPLRRNPGPCLLQYTSGSTATPKGVMIHHENLRQHFTAASSRWRNLEIRSAVSWLPPYHDMGLVLKILYSLESGIPLTLLSPDHFVQRPVRWLRAVSRHQAHLSGAPNFAYEMCVRRIRDEELSGLDLSCWKVAPCGAERIRPETLEAFAARFSSCGFDRKALMPGYGLAEATLVVTGMPPGEGARTSVHPIAGPVVSCGTPLDGTAVSIVDPSTGEGLPEGRIGEISVTGPMVSNGYWGRPDATRDTFGPTDVPALRTGDLGFMLDGHLHVTGRLKELIILHGTNHSPEDLEAVLLREIPEVTAAAAFAVDTPDGECLALALESDRTDPVGAGALCMRARQLLGEHFSLPVGRIVVLRSRMIPRTTSGKIRRNACRDDLESGRLRVLFDDQAMSGAPTATSGQIDLVLSTVAEVTGKQGARAGDDLLAFGMSSIEIARLGARLQERTGTRIPIGTLFSATSFADLAGALTEAPFAEPPAPFATAFHRNAPFRMTHSQERMWFLHRMDPSSAAYHVFGCLEMRGRLDIRRLGAALGRLVSRHAILRSRHVERDGGVDIRLAKAELQRLDCLQVSDEAEMRRQLREFAARPFDLQAAPPFRCCLVRLASDRHVFAICAHHLVADGWSMRLLGNELAELYRSGTTPDRGPESLDYLAYAAWNRGWIESGAIDGQIRYWNERLEGHPGWMPLATDFPRPASPSSAGSSLERTIPEALRREVEELAIAHRSTPFMIHLAAYLLQLRRLGGTDDPLIAIPVANRHHPGSDRLVGPLVNTLPFRMTLDPAEPLHGLLQRIRAASLEMQSAQDAPFEKILEAVGADRSRNRPPLVQVMFDHQELPLPGHWDADLRCTPTAIHRGAVQFDLSLLLLSMNDRQQIAVEYRTDLFREESASKVLDRHLAILEQICRQPSLTVGSVDPLSEGERIQLQRIGQGPSRPRFMDRATPSLILGTIRSRPQALAVAGDGGPLSYAGLGQRSGALACALQEMGIGKGSRVAVMLERDVLLPAVLLGIWRAGAAYVPLDPANPVERTARILEDQSPLPVIVSPSLCDRLPPGTSSLRLDSLMPEPAADPPFEDVELSPGDPAYILYTSGSTGLPKGVVIPHGALSNFLLSMAESPGFSERDSLLAITTMSFDISLLELFLPLVTGGRLEVASIPTCQDPEALIEKIRSSGINTLQATPATWRMLLEAGWGGCPSLRILCGGEALDPGLAETLTRMGAAAWNLYGPTETTVWSTLWRIPENPRSILIGEPIANTGVHVLSPDGTPAPTGVTGELWLSGAGLATGYWNRHDLTEAAFTRIIDLDGTPVRAYRTGDLARWRTDGGLECLGRKDGQIKIRGFRIELGEIEAALSSHPGVELARAACRGGTPETKRIVAWFTSRPGTPAPSHQELHEHLVSTLPGYMIPAAISRIDSFPLSPNGKVALSELPDPSQPEKAATSVHETPTEARLSAIWSELLDGRSIRPEDDWFMIGGHSLLVMRLFSRIHRDMNVTLPLSVILETPTLRGLAERIDRASDCGPPLPS